MNERKAGVKKSWLRRYFYDLNTSFDNLRNCTSIKFNKYEFKATISIQLNSITFKAADIEADFLFLYCCYLAPSNSGKN